MHLVIFHRSTMRKIHSLIKAEPSLAHVVRRGDHHHPSAGAVAQAQLYVARAEQDEGGSGFLKLVRALDQLTRIFLTIVRGTRKRRQDIEPLALAAIGGDTGPLV